jgi:hypothetical protein
MGTVQRQQPGAVARAELVADAVPDDGCEYDDAAHHDEGHVAAAGRDATEDGGGFAGEHEPDEQGVFGEDQQADDEVDDHAVQAQQLRQDLGHSVPLSCAAARAIALVLRRLVPPC